MFLISLNWIYVLLCPWCPWWFPTVNEYSFIIIAHIKMQTGGQEWFKNCFIEKEVLFMSQKTWKFFSGLYHAISKLLHVFWMISHSASPRVKSFKKHAITYIYWLWFLMGTFICFYSFRGLSGLTYEVKLFMDTLIRCKCQSGILLV